MKVKCTLMSKSKEELLSPIHTHCPEELGVIYYHSDILKVLDEYAKGMSIEFAEWLVKRNVSPINYFVWEDHGNAGDGGCPVLKTDQLFSIYLESLNKKP
jgi:hypothetical protein